MTKCDFCELEAIGYTSHQINLYCEDHEDRALEIERSYYADLERFLDTQVDLDES